MSARKPGPSLEDLRRDFCVALVALERVSRPDADMDAWMTTFHDIAHSGRQLRVALQNAESPEGACVGACIEYCEMMQDLLASGECTVPARIRSALTPQQQETLGRMDNAIAALEASNVAVAPSRAASLLWLTSRWRYLQDLRRAKQRGKLLVERHEFLFEHSLSALERLMTCATA